MPEFYNVAQAAVYLGLSRGSLYRLISTGRIGYHTTGVTGAHRRFTRAQLDGYLASTLVEPIEPQPVPTRAPKVRPFTPDGRHRIRLPEQN